MTSACTPKDPNSSIFFGAVRRQMASTPVMSGGYGEAEALDAQG